MPKRSTIPHRNRSPTGWWIFGEVQQWVAAGRPKPKPNSRAPVWENLRLVRARTREEAYRKAVQLARSAMPSKTDGGEWRFAGLSILLPIHEDLEHGSEVPWTDHGLMSQARLACLVRSKRDLSVFDDSEPA